MRMKLKMEFLNTQKKKVPNKILNNSFKIIEPKEGKALIVLCRI